MFRWDDIRVFLAVYRELHLTKAAKRLGVNQSTISRRLQALEEDLGVDLFERTPLGLQPTSAAEQILAEAELAEQSMLEMTRLLEPDGRQLEGSVRVAASSGLGAHIIGPVLPTFYKRYPRIALELVTGNAVLDLSRREADIALRFVQPQSGDLVAKRIASSDYGIYGSVEYLIDKEGIPYEELDWLAWEHGQNMLPEYQWYESNIQTNARFRSNDMSTLLNALLSGAGVFVLPKLFVRHLPSLREIPTPEPLSLKIDVWLVGHRTLMRLPRFRAVWEFIEETIYLFKAPALSDDELGLYRKIF